MGNEQEFSFRDKIATTNEEGRRSWIFANPPKGRIHKFRILVSILLLLFFFSGPFIKIDGQPLFLLDIFSRRFILFGKVFWPQDFHLFVIGLITIIVAIILFTVIYGRIWCGWACPQTIFMEMAFRKIEFWIEGNANKQRKLRQAPVTFEKLWKRTLKHSLFLIVSLIIAHTALAYLIGMDRVKVLVTDGPGDHMKIFIPFLIFTGAFYGIFSRFREQVCTLVCPYGRLQSVLLDSDSLVVAYDYKRGEDRGVLKKNENRQDVGKGDCISCNSCVSVCPTGIDIRNGTQLECINCTACIDACNRVMKRIGFKPGLIRFASENEISQGKKFRLNARIIAYSALLIVLITVLVVLFKFRTDTESTILHIPGTLYQVTEQGRISNMYNVKILNKSNHALPVQITLLSQEGDVQIIGKDIFIPAQQSYEGVILLFIDEDNINNSKTSITFGISNENELIEKVNSTFIGP